MNKGQKDVKTGDNKNDEKIRISSKNIDIKSPLSSTQFNVT